MKLFKDKAEYQAFKRKYEIMGELEEERLMAVAKNPEELQRFLQFIDEVNSLFKNSESREKYQEEELQADIERQKFFSIIPPLFYDPS